MLMKYGDIYLCKVGEDPKLREFVIQTVFPNNYVSVYEEKPRWFRKPLRIFHYFKSSDIEGIVLLGDKFDRFY